MLLFGEMRESQILVNCKEKVHFEFWAKTVLVLILTTGNFICNKCLCTSNYSITDWVLPVRLLYWFYTNILLYYRS